MAQISSAAYDRLAAELAELKGPQRLALADALEDARKAGKIEENTDFFVVREQQDLLERRITYLNDLLVSHEVCDEVADDGQISPGTVVTVRFDGDDETEELLIGEVVERHIRGMEVCSPRSPLGKALAGARAGDQVSYVGPGGTPLGVTVVSVAAA
jgi:transcription elongation factor GreA